MARMAFKPDSSFFRKIAIGAVGTRAVAADLGRHGHDVVELERGSTDTKLWKDVKRKRVRIPDLVCRRCGLRIESRAKTTADLAMSHSSTDEARRWDFGMVDDDLIAFPVCGAVTEDHWTSGKLRELESYWHERNWVRWIAKPHINYFRVGAFRRTPHSKSNTKGVTEGSETSIAWDATFSTRTGVVESVHDNRVTIRRETDGHRYTWRIRQDLGICVDAGVAVRENQVIASAVEPIPDRALLCPGALADGQVAQLLASRERTQRFTGVRLARLMGDRTCEHAARQLLEDAEEDVYNRLEAATYLASVVGQSARTLFQPFCESADQQAQLEAILAIGEAGTAEAVTLLCEVLDSGAKPYFLRSAAAWCLGRMGTDAGLQRLVKAFADVDYSIREEALDGIVAIGGPAVPMLLDGLRTGDDAIAAGCAESLRQQGQLPNDELARLAAELGEPDSPSWAPWLLGHLPRDQVAASIAGLQESAPHLHYAISLLWSFAESWIARRWELRPQPAVERTNETQS